MRLYLAEHDVRACLNKLALALLEQRLTLGLDVQEHEEYRDCHERIHDCDSVIQHLYDFSDDGKRYVAGEPK